MIIVEWTTASIRSKKHCCMHCASKRAERKKTRTLNYYCKEKGNWQLANNKPKMKWKLREKKKHTIREQNEDDENFSECKIVEKLQMKIETTAKHQSEIACIIWIHLNCSLTKRMADENRRFIIICGLYKEENK